MKGFSLLEMLVAIIIVFALAALLVPTALNFMVSAKFSRSAGQLQQIYMAINSFASDHNGLRPYYYDFPGSLPDGTSYRGTSFGAHLWHLAAQLTDGRAYLPDASVFFSPTQDDFCMDSRGGFRQKDGQLWIGYIWFVVGDWEHVDGGTPLRDLENDRITSSGLVPLLCTFGRNPVAILNAPVSKNKRMNILRADGSVVNKSMEDVDRGITKFNVENWARFMENLSQ